MTNKELSMFLFEKLGTPVSESLTELLCDSQKEWILANIDKKFEVFNFLNMLKPNATKFNSSKVRRYNYRLR